MRAVKFLEQDRSDQKAAQDKEDVNAKETGVEIVIVRRRQRGEVRHDNHEDSNAAHSVEYSVMPESDSVSLLVGKGRYHDCRDVNPSPRGSSDFSDLEDEDFAQFSAGAVAARRGTGLKAWFEIPARSQ